MAREQAVPIAGPMEPWTLRTTPRARAWMELEAKQRTIPVGALLDRLALRAGMADE